MVAIFGTVPASVRKSLVKEFAHKLRHPAQDEEVDLTALWHVSCSECEWGQLLAQQSEEAEVSA